MKLIFFKNMEVGKIFYYAFSWINPPNTLETFRWWYNCLRNGELNFSIQPKMMLTILEEGTHWCLILRLQNVPDFIYMSKSHILYFVTMELIFTWKLRSLYFHAIVSIPDDHSFLSFNSATLNPVCKTGNKSQINDTCVY